MSGWLFRFLKIARLIWVRTALISALAAVAAVLSPWLEPLLSDKLTGRIDPPALYRLLGILSTTMLSVTTFSLSVIAASHLSAAQAVTPRIHRLLREDSRTQTVLATFMGAFVYTLATQVLLDLGVTHAPGTVYLFTVVVLVLVAVAILRWIQHLSTLGALDSSTRRIEEECRNAIRRRVAPPAFGGRVLPAGSEPPQGAVPLAAPCRGYVQTIDVGQLGREARPRGGRMWLAAQPGDWCEAGAPLAWLSGGLAAAPPAELAAAFVIGDVRTYELDPAFGMIVLSEVASRALSPGINDPRTAEDVLRRLLGLLQEAVEPVAPGTPEHDWLDVPEREPAELIRLSLEPVARDGAAFAEVLMPLMRGLAHLAGHPVPAVAEAARAQARRVLAHADRALVLAEDRERLRAAAPEEL